MRQVYQAHGFEEVRSPRESAAELLRRLALDALLTAQLALPRVLEAHLENYFPFMGVMHGDNKILSLKECHFYLPESAIASRVFVLMYMQAHLPLAHLLKNNLLKLVDIVGEQDAKILSKIYPNTPQRIKLNNEVGMDWVRRNFEKFPTIIEPKND